MGAKSANNKCRSGDNSVTSDDEGSTVRVCVVIPGIKKKVLSSEAKNATVNFKPETQSFDLQVVMDNKVGGKKVKENFRYQIHKLPGEIDTEKTTTKVKDDQVVLILHKAKDVSWERELADTGLETLRDEDEEDK